MSDTDKPGGLAYTDNISVSWRPVHHELDQTHLAMVNASNEAFLRDVNVISDTSAQKDAPDTAISQELLRLDLKLNLVLDLVSTLIYHELDIPQTSAVRLSSDTVAWSRASADEVPEPGSTVYLELYIQRGLPKPLCCYGEVITDPEAFAQGRAEVRFSGLTGAARAWLEKLIFRHHRREVAYRRSTSEE